ncbi:E3 ubiquitin-protein ligase RNF34 [Neocloeon triangulifer]|uniref:E3 ubiquitin-protein ligase RNF34 n=1 Tax=Neocloeon triangulifer TaxID=2078957 RepID=UPI00286F4196|nr:E3 ubiquitin-protein ligase RNF34 [Neocloeon triangulifer]
MSTFLKSCRRILSDVPTRLSNAGIVSTEECENCHANFNIIRKKYICNKCTRFFCSDCLNKRVTICNSCRVLSTWPVNRAQLQPLKARDIKAYLSANGVSTHGCVEKEELVELALSHLGSRYQTHPIPPYSPRRMSTPVVDESWVLINERGGEPSSSSSGDTEAHVPSNHSSSASSSPSSHLPPDLSCPAPPPPTINVVSPIEVAPEEPVASEAVPIPGSREPEPEEPMSTSLPPQGPPNPLLTNLMGGGLSGSQPNLNASGSSSQGASGASTSVPQRSSSETILSISRTNILRLTDEELDKLPVKNLKILLTNHRVDFRGCCEKSELQDRVKRLRLQLQAHSKIDVDELSDENLCKVCMAAPIDCVLLDCGHLVTCTSCGKQMSECPICRQYVVRCVKIFRA